MKNLFLVLLVSLVSFSANANHHEGDTHKDGEMVHSHKHPEGSTTMMISTDESEIVWKGAKKFVESTHTGTVSLQSGQILFKDSKPVHGDFVIDMTTIKNTDLPSEDKQKKIVGHLNSNDFFAVDKFDTAKFSFTEVKDLGNNQYALTGEMEIRGTKNPETIQATIVMNEDQTAFTATADAVIDRTKYDVSYNPESAASSKDSWFFVRWFKGSAGLAKDKIISNDLNLKIKLVSAK